MLALLALLTPAYRFPVGKPIDYKVHVAFDGFLPILGVGVGTAVIDGTFQAQGQSDGAVKAGLTDFKLVFNGAEIPIDLDDAQRYFPDGSFKYAPDGELKNWKSPKVLAPVRVPGLDAEHLPEIAFMPVVFPASGVEVGKSFAFSRVLSGGDAQYKVTPTKATGSELDVDFTVHQSYSNYEDSANMVVGKKDAVAQVETMVDGKGAAVFDLTLGRFRSYTLDDNAVSHATDLDSGKTTERRLKRHFEIVSPGA